MLDAKMNSDILWGYTRVKKLLLLAAVLMLVASLAGDVFFVHHHLSGFSVESEHLPPQYASDFHNSLTGVLTAHEGLVLSPVADWFYNCTSSTISYCCGWHNSAYLVDGAVLPILG